MPDIVNSNVSYSGLVEKYIGTAYDTVKFVADNMKSILSIFNYTGITPPTDPIEGALWLKIDEGRLYIWYVSPISGSKQWISFTV